MNQRPLFAWKFHVGTSKAFDTLGCLVNNSEMFAFKRNTLISKKSDDEVELPKICIVGEPVTFLA